MAQERILVKKCWSKREMNDLRPRHSMMCPRYQVPTSGYSQHSLTQLFTMPLNNQSTRRVKAILHYKGKFTCAESPVYSPQGMQQSLCSSYESWYSAQSNNSLTVIFNHQMNMYDGIPSNKDNRLERQLGCQNQESTIWGVSSFMIFCHIFFASCEVCLGSRQLQYRPNSGGDFPKHIQQNITNEGTFQSVSSMSPIFQSSLRSRNSHRTRG